MNSTSFHQLESDRGLSKNKKIFWLLLNFLNNNWFPNKNIDHLNIKRFCPKLHEKDWEVLHPKGSPARAFCDFFWLHLDWEAIRTELGDICVFDTGCGAGGYSLKLNEFSKGINSYFGVDIKPNQNWEQITKMYKTFRFQCQTSNEIYGSIPKDTNFFITQSAIEHFKNDLLYFKQLKTFIDDSQKNTIQIHLFPSSACLKLYLWHGVRQYTHRTIYKITSIFDSHNDYSILYKLGGAYSSRLHFQYITKPARIMKQKDWRFVKNDEYRRLLKEAVEKDIQSADSKPLFYALIIHSNYKNKIF